MGKYFQHWLDIGKKLGDKAPKIFNVNWFRKDKNGKFMWPGFGDNLRVLEWIISRCDNVVSAQESPIGYIPLPEDINISDLDMSVSDVKDLLYIDKDLFTDESIRIDEFYKRFGKDLPEELNNQLKNLKNRLKA